MQNANRIEEIPNNVVSATKRIRYKDIIREVRSLGVPPHMKGYRYLCDAIELALGITIHYGTAMKVIYPSIAMKNQCSLASVEKSIRHAIAAAWDINKAHVLAVVMDETQEYRGVSKPSNMQIITALTENIKYR